MQFSTAPLSTGNWRDFEEAMGPQGACYGCWCTHFRMNTSERKGASAQDKKKIMQDLVESGQLPGLIAYDDSIPIGWVQVTPRANVPRWNTSRTVSRPLNEEDVSNPAIWAISCFFLKSKARGQGLSHKLLKAAIEFATQNGAIHLEACPIENAKHSKSVGLFVGPKRIFEAAGFQEIACRKDGRPLMRLTLEQTTTC